MGFPWYFGLNGVKPRSEGKTTTTVGTAVAVTRSLSTLASVSRKPSNLSAISRRVPAPTSPTTTKFGLSRRRQSAEAGAAAASDRIRNAVHDSRPEPQDAGIEDPPVVKAGHYLTVCGA